MKSKRPAILFIVITLVIDAMGIGLIVPVMPSLIKEITGGDISSASVWGGILSTIFAVMQFLFGPMLGKLSDRYGRRPVILLSLLIMAIDYVVMVFAPTMWLLLVTRIVGGITAATYATANAFVADISKPEDKAANFGLLGAAFGIGFVIGPLMGGALAEFGTRVPFMVAAVITFLNLIFGYFVLPETVSEENRNEFRLKEASPFRAFKEIGRFPGLMPLLVFLFIFDLALLVYQTTWNFFTQERFGWGPAMVGISLATYGISVAAVQGGLIRWLIPKFKERKTILGGLIIEVITLGLIAVITNGWIVLALIPISSLGGVVNPALQGIMSRRVSDREQGALQGVVTSVRSLAMCIAPLMMTQTFRFFTRDDAPVYFPGAPYLLAMVLAMICLVMFFRAPMTKALQ